MSQRQQRSRIFLDAVDEGAVVEVEVEMSGVIVGELVVAAVLAVEKGEPAVAVGHYFEPPVPRAP